MVFIGSMDFEGLDQDLTLFWRILRGFGWAGALAIYAAASVLLAIVAHYVFRRLQKRVASQGRLARSFNKVGRLFVPVHLFLIFFPLLFVGKTFHMPEDVELVVDTIAKVGSIFALVLISIRTIELLAAVYYSQLRLDQPDNLRHRRLKTQVQFLEKTAVGFIVFIGLAAILFSFERFRSIGGSLLASAGLASVIVGFSAQKSLGNLIAGFQIAFTQPIRLGDALLVENEWGEVEEITLTYVVVRIWDLRRLILPINYFLEKPFQNWTRSSATLIGQVLLYVDYSFPLDELRNELGRILRETPLWDGRVSALQVVDTTEKAMVVRVLASAPNSGATFDLRCHVREKLIAFLQTKYPEALPRNRLEIAPTKSDGFERGWVRHPEQSQ